VVVSGSAVTGGANATGSVTGLGCEVAAASIDGAGVVTINSEGGLSCVAWKVSSMTDFGGVSGAESPNEWNVAGSTDEST
jgi:hypothetical protein